eukprot:6439520-Prymnesium_polylepis.1
MAKSRPDVGAPTFACALPSSAGRVPLTTSASAAPLDAAEPPEAARSRLAARPRLLPLSSRLGVLGLGDTGTPSTMDGGARTATADGESGAPSTC